MPWLMLATVKARPGGASEGLRSDGVRTGVRAGALVWWSAARRRAATTFAAWTSGGSRRAVECGALEGSRGGRAILPGRGIRPTGRRPWADGRQWCMARTRSEGAGRYGLTAQRERRRGGPAARAQSCLDGGEPARRRHQRATQRRRNPRATHVPSEATARAPRSSQSMAMPQPLATRNRNAHASHQSLDAWVRHWLPWPSHRRVNAPRAQPAQTRLSSRAGLCASFA